LDQAAVLPALLTTVGTMFVAELTDKDALFLLALATRTRASVVFASGAIAFTISTAIIVAVGSVLLALVPVVAVKLAGGGIMLAYAVWELRRSSFKEQEMEERERKLLERPRRSVWSIFIPALVSLIALDLAGDATELVTVVLLARYDDVVVVFSGAVIGLVAATAVETLLGNRLGRVLSPKRIRYLSVAVFTIIGTIVIVTSLPGLS
jgi:putative Ca2+/H+ antiporter (TMEM165/GDT1 family)